MPPRVMKLTRSTAVVMNACQLTDRPIARAATCGSFHNSRPPDKILGIGPLRSFLRRVHRSRGCYRKRYRDVRKTIVVCDEPAMGNTAIQGGRFMSITEIGAKFKVSRHVKRPQFNRVTPSRDRGFLVGFAAEDAGEREGEGKCRRRIGSYPFNPVQAHEI